MIDAAFPSATRRTFIALLAAAFLAFPAWAAEAGIPPSLLAEFARHTRQRLDRLVGPAEWRPAERRLDPAAREALRARLAADATRARNAGTEPAFRFAEPPVVAPLPPPTPLFPDSLTSGFTSFAQGDIDGDAIPDLVGIEYDDSALIVRRGLVGGGFAAPQRFPLATGAFALALGDFDGDGRLDVATANTPPPGPTYSVLRNQGGTFGPRVDGPLVSGLPLELLAADLGHDGRLDLVIHTFDQSRVDLLIGRGNGTFEPVRSLMPGEPNRFAETALSVGDLDGDGLPDVAMMYLDGDCFDHDCDVFAVYYGRSDMTFESPEIYQAYDPDMPVGAERVAIGDRDGDGVADLMLGVRIGTYSPTRSAALARGGAGRRFEAPSLAELAHTPWALAAARLAPGAVPDLVVSDLVSTSLARNSGKGTFGAEQPIAPGALLAATDVDGDGLTDLVLGRSDTIEVRRANDAGGFASPAPPVTGVFVGVADVTGDRRPDLLVALPSGALGVAAGDGAGGFAAPLDWGTTLGTASEYFGVLPLAFADFDGDGRADAATIRPAYDSTFDDTLLIAWNLGDRFSAPDTLDAGPNTLNSYSPTFTMAIAAPDLDGDGRPDLVVLKGAGESGSGGFVTSVHNLGHRAFSAAQGLLGASEDPLQIAVSDFDGDGRADIAVVDAMTDYTGQFVLFRGTSDGTLEPVAGGSSWGGYAVHHYAFSIAAGDFNGDGRVDVAVGCGIASYTGAVIATLPNTTPTSLPTPALASLMKIDAQPDRVDLVWDASGMSTTAASVERREASTAWATLATVYADGRGRVSYVDRAVVAGARYAYRLLVAGTTSAEAWVDVPVSLALSIAAASPNPTTGPLDVRFTLPTSARARLELLDVSGRRVRERTLESPTPGLQRVAFDERASLAPGLYFLRVTQNVRAVQTRVVVVR